MANPNKLNLIGYDVETSGTLPEHALQPWRAPNDAWVTSFVWIHNGVTHGGLNPTKEQMLDMLVYAQENDCTIVGWNTTFDISWLIAYGLEDEVFKCKWLDGMLLWRHLSIEPEYEGAKKSYGLKAAVAEFMPAFADYEADIDQKLVRNCTNTTSATLNIRCLLLGNFLVSLVSNNATPPSLRLSVFLS